MDITTMEMHTGVIPEVSGTAAIKKKNRFYFDPEDPLKDGFLVR